MNESSLVSEYDNVDNIDQMISTTSTYEDVNTHDNTLLYDDVLDSGLCFIERTENTSLGTERVLFIREEDGKVIADFGRATNVSNDNGYFFVDINGDGIGELICNSQSADGAEMVIIFRNNNGTIQYGLISEEIVLEMFDVVQIDYPGALQEKYDDSNGTITLTLYNSDSEQYEEILLEFERLEVFEFYDYEYIE